MHERYADNIGYCLAVHLNVKKEESDRKLQYIMIGIGFIFFTYLCARTAYYMDATGQTSMFLAMVYVIPTLSENPFALAFNKTFFSVFGLGLYGKVAKSAFHQNV